MQLNSTATDETQVHVVIVDDDEMMLEIIEWNLRDFPISYRLFSELTVLRDFLSAVSPQILIVDFYMPDTNGLQLISDLKKIPGLSATKFYLCSAVRTKTSERAMAKAYDVDHIDKQIICNKEALHELLAPCV
ncbi:MAG: response regulator [Granulosicoccus sp.]